LEVVQLTQRELRKFLTAASTPSNGIRFAAQSLDIQHQFPEGYEAIEGDAQKLPGLSLYNFHLGRARVDKILASAVFVAPRTAEDVEIPMVMLGLPPSTQGWHGMFFWSDPLTREELERLMPIAMIDRPDPRPLIRFYYKPFSPRTAPASPTAEQVLENQQKTTDWRLETVEVTERELRKILQMLSQKNHPFGIQHITAELPYGKFLGLYLRNGSLTRPELERCIAEVVDKGDALDGMREDDKHDHVMDVVSVVLGMPPGVGPQGRCGLFLWGEHPFREEKTLWDLENLVARVERRSTPRFRDYLPHLEAEIRRRMRVKPTPWSPPTTAAEVDSAEPSLPESFIINDE
jgi:hypothetical protein